MSPKKKTAETIAECKAIMADMKTVIDESRSIVELCRKERAHIGKKKSEMDLAAHRAALMRIVRRPFL
jgi:hypothetical protein